MAIAVEAATVARAFLEVDEIPGGAEPLLEILFSMLCKGHTQRLEERRNRGVSTVAECQTKCELRVFWEVNLPDYRDIPILGPFKVPVEFQMILQVLPTVGCADVPARCLDESCARTHGKVGPILPGEKNRSARYT